MFPSALSRAYIAPRYCMEEVSGVPEVRGNLFETAARYNNNERHDLIAQIVSFVDFPYGGIHIKFSYFSNFLEHTVKRAFLFILILLYYAANVLGIGNPSASVVQKSISQPFSAVIAMFASFMSSTVAYAP